MTHKLERFYKLIGAYVKHVFRGHPQCEKVKKISKLIAYFQFFNGGDCYSYQEVLFRRSKLILTLNNTSIILLTASSRSDPKHTDSVW